MKKLFIFSCFVFLGLLTPAVTFAADTCKGFYDNNNVRQIQNGICFYYSDEAPNYSTVVPLLCKPGTCGITITQSCQEMAKGTGRGDAYHGISDDINNCRRTPGIDYRCCAPDDQSSFQGQFPPPPCTLDTNGHCTGVNTALGTILVDPGSLISNIFGILLSISGGIAIVIIILSGYRIVFSQGDPEKLQNARQHLTSAIIGLLFIIFSVVILRVIGVDILHLPGLNP